MLAGLPLIAISLLWFSRLPVDGNYWVHVFGPMVVLGVVTVLAALWSLYRPGDVYSEGAHAVLGVLFIVAPWVMGFSGISAMAITAWVVGAVTLVAGLLALPESNRLHHEPLASH